MSNDVTMENCNVYLIDFPLFCWLRNNEKKKLFPTMWKNMNFPFLHFVIFAWISQSFFFMFYFYSHFTQVQWRNGWKWCLSCKKDLNLLDNFSCSCVGLKTNNNFVYICIQAWILHEYLNDSTATKAFGFSSFFLCGKF